MLVVASSSSPPRGATLAAMRVLALEAAASGLMEDLRVGDVDALLLKGPSIDRWLYGDDEWRPFGDVDVLVSPDRLAHAERRLKALGFANRYDGVSPRWAEEHADSWISHTRPLPVDLHRRLWGFRAPSDQVWRRLWAGRRSLEIGGNEVHVLDEAAGALIVSLHAAHHGPNVQRPLDDLRRAIDRAGDDTWREAAELARELGADQGLAAGLGLVDVGRDLRERLGLAPVNREVMTVTPRMWSVPQTAEGFVRLAEAEGGWAKVRLLQRELLPSKEFMRSQGEDVGLARRGRRGLLAAYPARWLRLLAETPSGLRAARRLRKHETL